MRASSLLTAERPAVMARLRAATREHHHALDHHPELQRLVLPGLNRQGYASSLAAMRGPHAALEAAVWQGGQALGLTHTLSPRRVPRLRADLQLLGNEPEGESHPGSDRAGQDAAGADLYSFPTVTCPAQLLGLRYVLEGSRLGGEVLARAIRRALGDDAPVTFLADGEANHHWQALCAHAERELVTQAQQRRAIVAAQAAFTGYRAGLSGSDP
ncbi:biliverdin-producing heme oxygenase [Halomonas sp.]|uniref:biliverdin-producing heme oxygenase n=1 Tax=Halomonas sp. TaxID=1486246 RepID=UPI003D0BFC42